MAQPVFLLVLASGWTEAGYQLSAEERDSLWTKVQAVDERAGAKWIISCDSRWADEATAGWGVLEYPSMDAYLTKVKELEALSWWRYFSAKTILGTQSVDS